MADTPIHAHMPAMSRGDILLIVALVALLGGALYVSFSMWTRIGGDSGINGNGVAALVLGCIGTLALGGGLMALVFYSSRRGYDDAADLKTRQSDDR